MPIDVFSGDVELSFDTFFDWNAVDIKTEREEHVVSLHTFVASGKIDMGVMHRMTSVQWARGVPRGNIDAIGSFRTGEIEMINLHFLPLFLPFLFECFLIIVCHIGVLIGSRFKTHSRFFFINVYN